LANEPERPKIADETRAIPKPDARKPEGLAAAPRPDVVAAPTGMEAACVAVALVLDAGMDASRQE
jgi:hypothetical protein